MASRSSILAREIPCTEEPGELQSMGSQRVGLKRLSMHACMHKKRRKVSVSDLIFLKKLQNEEQNKPKARRNKEIKKNRNQ